MSAEFILILVVAAGPHLGPTSQAILFPSQAACETAKQASTDAFTLNFQLQGPRYSVRAICVPRGNP